MAAKKNGKLAKDEQANLPEEENSQASDVAKVTADELAGVTRRLADLLEQKQPLLELLETVANEQRNQHLRQVLMSVRASVRAGTALSAAMSNHPDVFPASYVEELKEGENRSKVAQALRRLADNKYDETTNSPDQQGELNGAAADESMDELLTLDQAVQFLGTSKPTMHRLLRQGDIKGLKVGRQWRFRKTDLVAHMERRPPEVAVSATEDLDAELQFFTEKLRDVPWSRPQVGGDDSEKIIHLVNAIIVLGIHLRASDIHIEPERQHILLRYRVDGVLQAVRNLPSRLHAPLLGRLKIMSAMDVTEKRMPQDGRVHVKYNDKEFDLRVTTLPSVYGEAITARILDQSSVIISRERLGFFPEDWEQVQSWLHQPNGLIFITGPTGSGKTTVLYTCLSEVTTPEKKVMSIEDPVEYQLPGVTQTHVNRKVGLTYAAALRTMMRSDPDIIMVGEMRDLETAQLAHYAAMTGHLVFSTLHTNSAAGTIVRLLDIGMEPFLLTQASIGITAQRLVRCVCEDCKEAAVIPPTLLERVRPLAAAGGYEIPGNATFSRGKGCAKCRNTGYRRRTGIYEVLKWSPELAEATLRRATEKELTEIAVAGGMKTLLADGVRKAVAGTTTLDEVLRIVTLSF